MLEELFQVLLQVLPSIIMIVIGYGATQLANQFKTNQYLVDCIRAVEKAVNITARRYTDSLKNMAGSLTKAEQAKALEMAKDIFLKEMGESAKIIIENLYGDFDEWISGEIDNCLGSDKK